MSDGEDPFWLDFGMCYQDLLSKRYPHRSDSSQRLRKETKENTDTATQTLSIIVKKLRSTEVG